MVAYAVGPSTGGVQGLTLTTLFADLAVLTIQAPGREGEAAHVKLDAIVHGNFGCVGCPMCFVFYRIVHDETGASSPERSFEISYAHVTRASGATTWVISVPTGVPQAFRLQAAASSQGTLQATGELSAITAPLRAP